MSYKPQNKKRLANTAKTFGASTTATIPPNTGFRVSRAGTYQWVPREPFPGDANPVSIAQSYSAGETVLCDIAMVTSVPQTGDLITVYAFIPQSD